MQQVRTLVFLIVLMLGMVIAPIVSAQDPIPLQDEAAQSPEFIGSAVEPRPIAMPAIPQHPFMAANDLSNMHHDMYMSDLYRVAGPLGQNVTVTSNNLNYLCPSMAFLDAGRMVGACLTIAETQLLLIDRESLALLAAFDLPAAEVSGFTDFPAGSYFYLDEQSHILIPTVDKMIWEVAVVEGADGPAFMLENSYDLSGIVAADTDIQSILPDIDGRLWFVTRDGLVGFINPADGGVASLQLDGESLSNSFATDDTGGVFIVTSHAMYRFDAGADGQPVITWREEYDRGTALKPGQASQGSGTTPTLMGTDYVAITDNAEPQMNVLVYQRAAEVDGPRLVCAVPVFGEGQSSTENSLIATDRSIIVENNFGYVRPLFMVEATAERGGMARIDVNPDGSCQTIWTNDELVPSVVSKMSLETGLIYTYTKDEADVISGAWYFTAIDFETGAVAFKQLTGNGLLYNNHYAAIYLSPEGHAFIPVIGGLVTVRDGN